MTNRKFYKTVIKFTVLSEVPIPSGMTLGSIADECLNGDWSMGNYVRKETEIDGKQAANALLNQGSEPEFFGLTDKGKDNNQ